MYNMYGRKVSLRLMKASHSLFKDHGLLFGGRLTRRFFSSRYAFKVILFLIVSHSMMIIFSLLGLSTLAVFKSSLNSSGWDTS